MSTAAPPTKPADADVYAVLTRAVRELRDECRRAETEHETLLAEVHPTHDTTARNLVHYLALRRHDLRPLQDELTRLGLSSLGRCESDVLGAVDAVLAVTALLGGLGPTGARARRAPERAALQANAERLLGPLAPGRSVRTMVTLPSAAARDPGLVADFVAAGMDVARINGAHDGPAAWEAMARHVRNAAVAQDRFCGIAFDLAGPKLRTGPMAPGLPVQRVSPRRDERGRVVEPAQMVLHDASVDPPAGVVGVPVPVADTAWLLDCHPGDAVSLRDASDAVRRLTVVSASDGHVVVTTRRTVYLETGLALDRRTRKGADRTTVGPLPQRERHVTVRVGDEIVLTPVDPEPGFVPPPPVSVSCTAPEVIEHVQPGERVWFDDGKIGAVAVGRGAHGVVLRITHAKPAGSKLRGGKGINLPDTDLPLQGLTEQDERDLEQAVAFADVVDVSFVRTPADVERVQDLLRRLHALHVGIVLKIETVSGFRNLPEILLTALRWPAVGVMIARGDLAVEAGFERLAEVQEEILWLCEAGHVPVVWATEVLDHLARTGRPSRAEISDVSLGARAECVMLNKGPHVLEAIATLADIQARMHDHQHKKRSLLRRLRAWDPPGAASAPPVGERTTKRR